MWVGTEGGLARYRKQSQRWEYYNRANSGLPGNNVRALALGEAGEVWVGTHTGDVAWLDGKIWEWVPPPQPPVGVTALHVDHQGVLWAGTDSGGVHAFDGTSWRGYQVVDPFVSAAMIASILSDYDRITALTVDRDRATLWVGTEDGLARYDGASWEVFSSANSGLPSSVVLSLLSDADDRVWVGCPS